MQQVGLAGLETVQKDQAQLAILNQYGAQVQAASASNPKDWQDWWWVCVGGEAVFIPFVFVMAGRWSPRKAREDVAEHERAIAEQLRALSGPPSDPPAAAAEAG